mgnify:CR=1 FL=1
MTIGAQLYTLRAFTQNETDLARALECVAAIGYTQVQLSAIGSIPPERVRRLCDDAGLQIVLTHTDPERVRTEIGAVMDEHAVYGCRYVGLGAMPERYRCAAWIDRFAEDYAAPAEALRAAGLRLMYHNHNFEWERLPDGRRMLDVLLDAMPASLMGITLDTYWVQAAGADVLATLRRLKGRLQCVHLKDMDVRGYEQRMAPVGHGNLDFDAILALLREQGETEHLLVEQDDCYGRNPFDCLAESYRYLKERA